MEHNPKTAPINTESHHTQEANLHAPITDFEFAYNEIKARFEKLESERADLELAHAESKTKITKLELAQVESEAKIVELEQEIIRKKLAIELLTHKLFGRKSEKLSSSDYTQLSLLFNEAEACIEYQQNEENNVPVAELVVSEEEKVPVRKAAKRGRKKLPETLPREEVIHDLADADKICKCGCQMVVSGQETSEQLLHIPAQVKVVVHTRLKYACKKCQEGVRCAALPSKPIPKSYASSSLLAHILVSKFADHLPLYRQSQMYARQGINISRIVMCNWVIQCGKLFEPLIKLLHADIVAKDYVCSDETTLNVLQMGESTCYMWVHLSGERERRAIIFEYHSSREGGCATEFLKSFKGYLSADAYGGYNDTRKREDVRWVACWAHARRKFTDITKVVKEPGLAHKFVILIGKLYAVEREAAEGHLTPDKIKELRAKKSTPILADIKEELEKNILGVPPKSKLASAMLYSLRNWEGLQTYLQDGRLRIDNNDAEKCIRPFAIGRKNWMFCASEAGANASANIYSLIETCKINNINPYDYFNYVLDNIHNVSEPELKNLLPYNVDKNLLQSSKNI